MSGLTLRRLKNTNFKNIYEKLVKEQLSDHGDYKKILSLASIFINEQDEWISKLGYRILVFYCNHTKNYKPLYDVALNNGLTPIVKLIERIDKYEYHFEDSFFGSFHSSYGESYKKDGIYLSEQQQDLFMFFEENQKENVSVIAPTSYGKSELIISSISKFSQKNICVLVPTKALLAQTKRRLMQADIKGIHKIVTHPEMYLESDENTIAVLTQERLLRLLRKDTKMSFDLVFVDEAHNLLENDQRNILLAATITMLEKRNPTTIFKFLTPFLVDETNLSVKYSNYSLDSFEVTEYIKTEKFFIYDFKNDHNYKMYDHFINEFFELKSENYKDDIEFLLDKKGAKNLIYLNKPADIEKLARKFTSKLKKINSEILNHVCKELSEYVHEEYFLIDCIKKGFIYHHGSVPDNIRSYIEKLFSDNDEFSFVITSSTLLEGVNLPVEKMFLLDNKKGRSNLSPSQFKNLIGRVCRFSEIFSAEEGDLEKLEPEIFLVRSDYYSQNANIEEFIRQSVQVDKKNKDDAKNVLLKNVKIDEENIVKKQEADEFIENFEPGIVEGYENSYAETELGKLCFVNNISEINIIKNEKEIQSIFEKYSNIKFTNAEDIFEAFSEMFLPFIKEGNDYTNLSRLMYPEARNFYKMFLNWRMRNAPYKEMIQSFLNYWKVLESRGTGTDIYVNRWGDKARDGYKLLWTDIKDKNPKQRVNLAIVRIKEEQDFLDNTFVKYIEVMNDLEMLDTELYEKIKYGTSNKEKVALIKNGFSSGLANVLVNSYINYIQINTDLNAVTLSIELIESMKKDMINDILVHEAQSNMILNLKS